MIASLSCMNVAEVEQMDTSERTRLRSTAARGTQKVSWNPSAAISSSREVQRGAVLKVQNSSRVLSTMAGSNGLRHSSSSSSSSRTELLEESYRTWAANSSAAIANIPGQKHKGYDYWFQYRCEKIVPWGGSQGLSEGAVRALGFATQGNLDMPGNIPVPTDDTMSKIITGKLKGWDRHEFAGQIAQHRALLAHNSRRPTHGCTGCKLLHTENASTSGSSFSINCSDCCMDAVHEGELWGEQSNRFFLGFNSDGDMCMYDTQASEQIMTTTFADLTWLGGHTYSSEKRTTRKIRNLHQLIEARVELQQGLWQQGECNKSHSPKAVQGSAWWVTVEALAGQAPFWCECNEEGHVSKWVRDM